MTESELLGLLQQADGIIVAVMGGGTNPVDPSLLDEAASWKAKYDANFPSAGVAE